MGAKHLPGRVSVWRTSGDRTSLLEPSTVSCQRAMPSDAPADVAIDTHIKFQPMLGFGAAMTDASAYNLWHLLPAGRRDAVMENLFTPRGINLSVLRLPVGASDFSTARYTYDDRRWPRRDRTLEHFSIARDERYLIPLLRQARDLNHDLSLVASPWSAPAWMKRLRRLNGGRLKGKYYDDYARYLVRYLEDYAAAGLPIYALTVQNEPGHATSGYPSMPLDVDEQASFITDYLRPAISAAGLPTKILAHDHNWSDEMKVRELLAHPSVTESIAGIAWHAYGGEPTAQSRVQTAHPGLETHFTEITGSQGSEFGGDLGWGLHNIMIGATANWARSVCYWNLALDDRNGPLSGGYASGRGVITVYDDGTITRNVEYYTLGHLSKFVRVGARRIAGAFNDPSMEGVAFINPNGSKVLLMRRVFPGAPGVTVQDGSVRFTLDVADGEAVTAVWP